MSTSKTIKSSETKSVSFAKTIEEAVNQLDQVSAELGDSTAMSASQKRHAAKPRKGASRIVASLADLAKAHRLDSQALDSNEMVESQKKADALGPLEVRLTRLLQRVVDERFAASAVAWESALQFYALMQRRALNNGQLASNLAPIEDLFAYRHGSVLDGKPTKLQTRAKAKLARAQELVSHAHNRVGAPAAPSPAPIVTAPAPVMMPQPVAAPVAAPVYAPVTQPVAAPVSTQMFVTPKSNGALNGSYNGASNGAVNGSGG